MEILEQDFFDNYDLHRAYSFIDRFFWDYSSKLVERFSPKERNALEKTNSVASKVFYLTISPFMLVFSIALTIAAFAPRIVVNLIQKKPFTYRVGNAQEKHLKENEKISVFTCNVCFVAGGFSLPFGGVKLWHDRIDDVVGKIKSSTSDVVCLQEVNDVEACYSLYEKLKDEYAYFCFNIGPEILSQNSGIFVASKYPIQDAKFTPFDTGIGLQKAVNKGFFDFNISSEDRVIARIVATHLPPSKDDQNPTKEEKIQRENALNLIVQDLEKEKSYPSILVGDMNLVWGSDEYRNSAFPRDFVDPYNDKRSQTEEKDSTCATDYLIDYEWKGKIEKPCPAIVDYALLYNKDDDTYSVNSSLCPMFDYTKPEEALSDHQALVINVSKKEKGKL